MNYNDRKKVIIRRIALAALVVLSAVLQNTCGTLSSYITVRPFLLLPACVAVSIFETNTVSALYGVLAGALWDVSSSYDGFNTLTVMLLSAVCSLLVSHFMQKNMATALVLGASSIAIYEILYAVICNAFHGISPFAGMLTYYLPALLLTAVFIPVYYFAVKAICKRTEVAA